MNKKRFEIWQKWKVKQLQIDLEEVAEDMAGRGLAQSGVRNQKEERLKEKYRDEIAMEKAAMEAEELETQGRHKERKNQFRTSWLVAAGSVIAAVSAVGSVVLALPIFTKQINNIEVKIDSIESNIRQLYKHYNREIITCDQIKNGIVPTEDGALLTIHLKDKAIPNSVNVWWGEMYLTPMDYSVNEDVVTLHFIPQTPDAIIGSCNLTQIVVAYVVSSK